MAKRTCSIDGCERPARSRGMCTMHYSRWRKRGGDPAVKLPPGNPARPIIDRLNEYVDRDDPGGCWVWTGLRNEAGYGIINVKGLVKRAHRLMYVELVGPIPADRPHLDHLCRVRHCVNPDHLEPVTNAVNSRRGADARTTCRNGHPWSESNTYVRKDTGARQCKACGLIRNRERWRRQNWTTTEAP